MMADTSILSSLTQPNPTIDHSGLRDGTVTKISEAVHVVSTTKWTEFNYRNLYNKFRHILESRHPIPTPCTLSPRESKIFDEDTFEHQVLSRVTIPSVNYALDAAANFLSTQHRRPFPVWQIRRGAICVYEKDAKARADWGLVSDDFLDNLRYFYNFMPGDSKISSKWSADAMETDADDDLEEHHSLPVQQVGGYCDKARSRYGFVITDEDLVVIEFRRDPIGSGIAATSTRARVAAATAAAAAGPTVQHHRGGSVETVRSSITVGSIESVRTRVSALTLSTTAQGQTFSSRLYENDDLGDPVHLRYMVIPWHAEGEGKLTVRSALFFLALMAAYGDGQISEEFSKLDSWSFDDFHKRMEDNSDRYQLSEVDPGSLMQRTRQRSRGDGRPESHHDTDDGDSDDADDDSSDDDERLPHMSDPYHVQGNKKYVRRSVISSDAHGPFYHDTDGSRRSIREDQLLYDRRNNEWGYIRGGEWVVAKASTQDHAARSSGAGGESSSGRGKHARKESTELGASSKSKRGRGGR